MHNVSSPTTLISFAMEALADASRLLSDYSSKFSRKDFKQAQLMALAGLHQRYRLRWRELEELVTEMPRLRMVLGLKKAPDFSTIPKFLKRISPRVLNHFFRAKHCEILAVDATGFSSTTASPHYEKRCGKKRPYLKSTIAIDTKTLEIHAVKVRRSHAHDTRDFPSLVKRCKFDTVVADKGYDDEKLHRLVHKMGARSIIPVRERKRKKVIGRHRKKLAEDFDQAAYNQRPKAETGNSSVKRKFGEDVRSRSTNMQKKELKVKFWAYNVDRRVILRTLHHLLRWCL